MFTDSVNRDHFFSAFSLSTNNRRTTYRRRFVSGSRHGANFPEANAAMHFRMLTPFPTTRQGLCVFLLSSSFVEPITLISFYQWFTVILSPPRHVGEWQTKATGPPAL